MTLPTRPHSHMSLRAREVLDNQEQDSLWHCDYCATNQRGEVVFATLVQLEAHINAGHPAQTEEERMLQIETVKHIDSQVLPEPEPYIDPEQPLAEVQWLNPPPLDDRPVGIVADSTWDDLLALTANRLVDDEMLGKMFRAWVRGS